MAMAMFVTV